MAEAEYGLYLNDLHFGEATLSFPQTLALRYRFFESAQRRQPQVAGDYAKWFLASLRTLEPRLQYLAWLCAGRFMAADVSVGYALLLAQHLEIHTHFTPAVADYWQRLQERPAYQRAQALQFEAARSQGVPLIAAPDLRPRRHGSGFGLAACPRRRGERCGHGPAHRAVEGRRLGRRLRHAARSGVLIEPGDALANMVMHRGDSHALFWLSLAALPLGAAIAVLPRERTLQ